MAILDLNTIKEALQMSGKIEFYPQILETQEKLLEMQRKINVLESENKRLREENEIQGHLVSEKNIYWVEKNGAKDGPFCTRCWDDEHKLIRLHKSDISDRVHCPKCSTTAKSGTAHVFRPIDHRRNSAI